MKKTFENYLTLCNKRNLAADIAKKSFKCEYLIKYYEVLFDKEKRDKPFDLNTIFDLKAPTSAEESVLNASTELVFCPCTDAAIRRISALLDITTRQHYRGHFLTSKIGAQFDFYLCI